MTYCLAVERLAQTKAPARAQAIRVLFAELERIHSHLLWLGVTAHEAGFDTLFMYSWRDRETVMDILEQLSGNRVNYSANVLGGVKFDVEDAHIEPILKGIDFLDERTRFYLEVVSTDALFLQRTRNIGTMSRLYAEVLGTVGPTARASGVDRDIRTEAPYAAYDRFPIQITLDDKGDLERGAQESVAPLARLISNAADALMPEPSRGASIGRRADDPGRDRSLFLVQRSYGGHRSGEPNQPAVAVEGFATAWN
ncbi:MAG: hypothetical protein P8Z41_03825 [Anaerolineales bacterium]